MANGASQQARYIASEVWSSDTACPRHRADRLRRHDRRDLSAHCSSPRRGIVAQQFGGSVYAGPDLGRSRVGRTCRAAHIRPPAARPQGAQPETGNSAAVGIWRSRRAAAPVAVDLWPAVCAVGRGIDGRRPAGDDFDHGDYASAHAPSQSHHGRNLASIYGAHARHVWFRLGDWLADRPAGEPAHDRLRRRFAHRRKPCWRRSPAAF